MSELTVATVDIPGIDKFISGKVREVFDLGKTLLVVASDRLSAFDVILPTPIPGKGHVLTALSEFWFDATSDLVPNHFITSNIDTIVDEVKTAGGTIDSDLRQILLGRSMLVKKAKALPVECVARGYISGSLWKEYKAYFAHGGTITVNGVALPVGLRESDKLPETIFTPASKSHSGHDENISYDTVVQELGQEAADLARQMTLKLYEFASSFAIGRGIIIADTKFEFGYINGQLAVIDEVLTPDSSRFWERSEYRPGKAQASYDKQFVRDYLETLDWDKSYPGPTLPDEVVTKTAQKYKDAYLHLTGLEL